MTGRSEVQGSDAAVKHWLVLGRDPDDSTFIVWDAQTAGDHRETGYRVDGPFVPLADAEKLATALESFYVEQRTDSAAWFLEAKRVLEAWRAAYPREETTG